MHAEDSCQDLPGKRRWPSGWSYKLAAQMWQKAELVTSCTMNIGNMGSLVGPWQTWSRPVSPP